MEYERTITTVNIPLILSIFHDIFGAITNIAKVANSYVKPSVSLYLNNLLKSLQGKTKHLRILRSDGGLSSVALASKFPVSMALSGPAGGVSGVASVVAAQTKYKNLITVDMGVSFRSFSRVNVGKQHLTVLSGHFDRCSSHRRWNASHQKRDHDRRPGSPCAVSGCKNRWCRRWIAGKSARSH